MLCVIGWLVFDKFEQEEQTQIYITELENTQFQRDSVQNELTTLWEDYETLKTDNDTLNARLHVEQQKIEQMLKQIRTANSRQITQYKKELATLRQVMRGYIVQIDSLNRINQVLVAENEQIRTDYRRERTMNEELAEENDSLTGQVEIASELRAMNVQIYGLNRRDKVTRKVDKVEKFQVCCDLSANAIAPKGTKDVYIRIARPDGLILTSAQNNVFEYQGNTLAYSSKRGVKYTGEKVPMCVYWFNDEVLPEGIFNVDIFVDGKKIGTSSLELK